jgi:hypothetical protein
MTKELYKTSVKGTVVVPKQSSINVPHSFQYSKSGTAKITYTLYYAYNNKELDKWSGEVTVTP